MRPCPECGEPMEAIEAEPDVGITGGWECECGHHELFDDADDDPGDPYTLDAAYAALPPGWRWEVHQDPRGGKPDIWRVSANQNHHDGGTGWLTFYSEDPDHKLALLRTACKAWAVVKGAPR